MDKVITGAVIQARVGSSRLSGKVIRLLHRQPLITHVINRVKTCRTLDKVVLATSFNDLDEVLVNLGFDENCKVFRGDENNVLNRFVMAAQIHELTNIVRVTGDNPLISPSHLDQMVEQFLAEDLDYSWIQGLPLGLGCEVVKGSVLADLDKQVLEDYHREHVTIYIRENLDKYKARPLIAEGRYQRSYRLTVDCLDDFRLMEKIYANLYKPGYIIDIGEALTLLDNNPQIAQSNSHIEQQVFKPTT